MESCSGSRSFRVMVITTGLCCICVKMMMMMMMLMMMLMCVCAYYWQDCPPRKLANCLYCVYSTQQRTTYHFFAPLGHHIVPVKVKFGAVLNLIAWLLEGCGYSVVSLELGILKIYLAPYMSISLYVLGSFEAVKFRNFGNVFAL